MERKILVGTELQTEFEELWEEKDGYAGLDISEIIKDLTNRGWDAAKRRKFGLWFVLKAMLEGWLLDELGFFK